MMNNLFALRDIRAQHLCLEAKNRLMEINGPISALGMLEMKSLQYDLDAKIKELEKWSASTAATATIPTGKAQATSGCVSRLQDTEQAS